MIGNVTVATNMSSLNYLVQTRLSTKVAEYASRSLEAPKCKVIVVDDLCPNSDDYICASILLPDTKSMDYLIGNDYNSFRYLYTEKLGKDPDIYEYCMIILAGLMEKGFDYILYFDFENNYNMPQIATVLCEFLTTSMGIIPYSIEAVAKNPEVLKYQSIDPRFMMQNKQALINAGYSSSCDLFQSF